MSSTSTDSKGEHDSAGSGNRIAMVRNKPHRRRTGLRQSARTRQARRAQERARAAQGPPLSGVEVSPGSEAHAPGPEDDRLVRMAAPVRYALLGISLVMLLWFMTALRPGKVSNLEIPLPTWALDVAALSPLAALARYWNPEIRKKTDTLEFDLKLLSGLYFLMAILGAALGGYWQLWPGVAISVAVHAGIWHTNRQARDHG